MKFCWYNVVFLYTTSYWSYFFIWVHVYIFYIYVLFVGTLHCTYRKSRILPYSGYFKEGKLGRMGGGSNYDFLYWTMWSEIIWSVHQGDVYNYVVKHNKAFPPIIPIGISNQQFNLHPRKVFVQYGQNTCNLHYNFHRFIFFYFNAVCSSTRFRNSLKIESNYVLL